MNSVQAPQQQPKATEDSMILLQLSIVNKLIKKHFPDKVVNNDFKKEFTKSLSIFILFLQNAIDKKKYGRQQILMALQKQGLAKVAENLRNNKNYIENRQKPAEKRILDLQNIEQLIQS